MAAVNHTFVLAERPKGHIEPGKTFRYESGPAPTAADVKDGEVLVQIHYLGLDPAMRGWLNDTRSYLPPVGINEKMRGYSVGRVLASKSKKVKEGDIVHALTGWAELAIVPESVVSLVQLPKGTRPTDALGVLGSTGFTAYFGLEKIGQPKAGETVVVSGAAGATGSVVGQICKLRGARVIGIAGSDDKCKWLVDELGFDVGINYKAKDFWKQLKEATPDFIDVYWDNVGGQILDFCLLRAAMRARFVMCGSISGYNNEPGAATVRNLFNVTAMRIRMEGFIVLDYSKEFGAAARDIGKWLSEGKIKRKETIRTGGLKVADQAISDLFLGRNTGKLLVEVKPFEETGKASL